jgi:hypothetical protein
LQVPLGVRILLLRRLAQVRYGLPGPPKTSAPSQPFLKMCSPGCLRVSVLCICVCLCVTA